MKQRGRKSADLLALPAVEVPRPQLEPPRSLTKAERLLFTELAANAPHLKPSDAPLLVSYVQATIASRRSARDPSKANLWEKATRLQASLATKLRLTAQARIDPQTLGRQRPPQTGPLPWEKTRRCAHTRGDAVINWIETYCLFPDGPHKDEPVRLAQAEVWLIRQIYDSPSGPNQTAPFTGALAAYLALLHVCGPEALQKEFQPQLDVDVWTIWRATSKELQAVLKRNGETVVCPELGTRYPAAA